MGKEDVNWFSFYVNFGWHLTWESVKLFHHGSVWFNHLIKWGTRCYHALSTLIFFPPYSSFFTQLHFQHPQIITKITDQTNIQDQNISSSRTSTL